MKKTRFAEPTDLSGLIQREMSATLPSDISIQRLIDDSLLVLSREIRNLKALSVNGKLEPNDARDLRDHLKLLFELKDRESESLKGMTDEQIEATAVEVLKPKESNDSKQTSAPSGDDKA